MSSGSTPAALVVLDWAPGDMTGLPIPARAAALRSGGTSFLTEAFRANGVLAADNRVTQITRFEECPGGSTGRKVLLSVTYEKPAPGLSTDLFVKFSRDFEDAIRDRGKIQMELEARFALLSQIPGFPIEVPKCFFADYHQESGTGILITERIAFGTGEVERHYEKCLDYEMPEPLEHYHALLKAIARLAGADRSGRLPGNVAAQFPFDPGKLTVGRRHAYTAAQLQKKIEAYRAFAASYTQLLPQNITSSKFIARLAEQAPRFAEHELSIKHFLRCKPELIALCHWNAHVDNAWFWRNARGELECGLLDWGHVSQMNVAMALGGCLTGAEPELLVTHFDALLALFVAEFQRCGAPALDVGELKLHLLLYLGVSGLLLLDAPVLIQRRVPDLAGIASRLDPRIRGDEFVRAQLHMLTVFLTLWCEHDFGMALDEFLRRR
jgi:hypothetical protein